MESGGIIGVDLADVEITPEAGRALSSAEHALRLLAAFGGDVRGWEWTGEVIEQDPKASGGVRCACSHAGLRYLFPWTHPEKPGEQIITGSVCVGVVPGLSEASVDRIQERARELVAECQANRRRQLAAAKVEKVAKLRAQVEAALEALFGSAIRKYEELRARDVAGDRGAWSTWTREDGRRRGECLRYRENIAESQKLLTPAGQRKRLESQRAYLLQKYPGASIHFPEEA